MADIARMRFCPYCATPLTEAAIEAKVRPTCPACGFRQYANPVSAVNAVVVVEGHILLVRRGHEPFAGMWALPGGFVDWGEEAAVAAVREALEETGIEVEVSAAPVVLTETEDPRGDTLNVNYPCTPVAPGRPEPVAGDDAEAAAWWPLDARPDLAFTNHERTLVQLGVPGRP